MRRNEGLDVARSIAILMVLIYHGSCSITDAQFNSIDGPFHVMLLIFKQGWCGVHLFYVLSGFLITGILLNTHDNDNYLSRFYLRRACRIIPAYALMILLLYATGNITGIYIVTCILFLCNMSSIFGVSNQYGPFWSLSVEEQFYLIWPLSIKSLKIESIKTLCIALIVGTTFLRFMLLSYGPPVLHDVTFKTWCLTDFFAVGALGSILLRQMKPAKYAGLPMMAVGLLWFVSQYLFFDYHSNLEQALRLTPLILLFGGAVFFLYNIKGLDKYFIVKVLSFVANISYGLYLIHQYVMTYTHDFLIALDSNISPLSLVIFTILIGTLVSVAIAWLSRVTIEEWFLRRGAVRTDILVPTPTR